MYQINILIKYVTCGGCAYFPEGKHMTVSSANYRHACIYNMTLVMVKYACLWFWLFLLVCLILSGIGVVGTFSGTGLFGLRLLLLLRYPPWTMLLLAVVGLMLFWV